ncbi:MAG: tyrosine-type recombinase/integrase [Nitrospiria bacterium]
MNEHLKNRPDQPESPDSPPKGDLKPHIEEGNKIYDRIDVYLFRLNQLVIQKERTSYTFEAYSNSLKRFNEWGKERGFPNVDPPLIERYKEFLIQEGLQPATINLYLVALRQFFEYYAKNKWIAYNPVRLVRGVKQKTGIHKKNALTIDEAQRLLSVIKRPVASPKAQIRENRDYALIYLMLKTGLRAIEVVRAQVGDIKTKEGEKVLYVLGKGDREKLKFVVLAKEVYNALMDNLTVRGFSKPEDPLFAKLVLPTKSGRPRSLSTRALEQIVTKYMLKAGIKTKDNPRPEITLHSLRHTTANLALDGGAPIVNVQEMMRHEDITTTMIYVKQWNRVKQAAELHIKQI